jgi:hypothetical protein
MLGDKPILPWYCMCLEGAIPRKTISAKWLRHFNELTVGETAAPAGLFAGERGGGRNATVQLGWIIEMTRHVDARV